MFDPACICEGHTDDCEMYYFLQRVEEAAPVDRRCICAGHSHECSESRRFEFKAHFDAALADARANPRRCCE